MQWILHYNAVLKCSQGRDILDYPTVGYHDLIFCDRTHIGRPGKACIAKLPVCFGVLLVIYFMDY